MARTHRATTSGEISERLHGAIEVLRKDLRRVEIWAEALQGFAEPVPSYRPDDRYLLPRRRREKSCANAPEKSRDNATRASARTSPEKLPDKA